ADLMEAVHELDLGPGRGLEDPIALHEEALVVDERGVAHERLHDPDAPRALAPGTGHSEQPRRELLVCEGVVAEHLARAVAAYPEHGTLVIAEDGRGQGGFTPTDHDVERVLSD